MRGASRHPALAALAAAGLAMSGCTATIPPARGPADLTPPAEYYADYRPASGGSELWWQGFADPVLDQLVQDALADNLDVAAANSRLRAARALVDAEQSDLLPSAGVSGSVGGEADTAGDSGLVAGAGLSAQLDLDLSGRLSAEVQAAAANAAAAEYFLADQRRLVAAAVAGQYIELRRTGARLALLEESTDLQQQTLRIVTLRFEAGLSANLDVRRAAADLAQTRAQLGLLRLARARAGHALSVLTGDTPGAVEEFAGQDAAIPAYAGGPPTGAPADLLRRRSDILVAEAGLVEAAARVGVERSDLLPNLVLPANLVLGDGSLGGLVSDFFATVGASLDLPLFDGGRHRAEIAAAEAEADARFFEYRLTFLNALAEVENSLVAIDAFTDRNTELRQAIEESETAFEQSRALYREGLASLFDVLDAQRQLIASRQSLIDSEADLAASIIALYAATGADPGSTPIRATLPVNGS